jgi:hypothetical protein
MYERSRPGELQALPTPFIGKSRGLYFRYTSIGET